MTFHEGQLLEPVAGLEVHRPRREQPAVRGPFRARRARARRCATTSRTLALFPPGDALAIYRRLVPAAARALRPGGALAVEISPALPEGVTAPLPRRADVPRARPACTSPTLRGRGPAVVRAPAAGRLRA